MPRPAPRSVGPSFLVSTRVAKPDSSAGSYLEASRGRDAKQSETRDRSRLGGVDVSGCDSGTHPHYQLHAVDGTSRCLGTVGVEVVDLRGLMDRDDSFHRGFGGYTQEETHMEPMNQTGRLFS